MTSIVAKEELYEKLMTGAKRIGKIAEREAMEADANSTISQNVVDAIVGEGINRLIIPKEYGYPQIDFTTFTDMVKTVGYYNLSAAWLTYFFSLHNSWVAYLPKHRMDEIYNDGGLIADIFAPVGKAERTEGGYILNGKWNFVSGVNYSGWISVGANVFPSEGPPIQIALCMKVSELEVIQDWNSVGLRGSGSNSVIAKDLFVADDMVLYFEEIVMNRKGKSLEISEDYLYYNTSYFPAFYVGFPAMCIGAAERVIDEFVERTKKRVRLDGSNEGESPKSQRVAADLTIKLKAAKGLLVQYIHMLETDEGQYSPGLYNGIRVNIVRECLNIAVIATSIFGAGALSKGNIFEIMTRDLLTISTHITSLYEDGMLNMGQALFGITARTFG